MAGGVSSVQLVSAVSCAGGIGSFGFAYSPPELIKESLASVDGLPNRAVNANFFVFEDVETPTFEQTSLALRALEALPKRGSSFKVPQAPYFPSLEAQIAPVWEHPPEIITFHFGIPDKSILEKAKCHGIFVGVTATNVTEALAIQDAGADFIVAQGYEAGGHRGMFKAKTSTDEKLNAMDLLAAIHGNCSIPIVSAGGIMTGGDIRRYLNKGAVAAQMGTAFLVCHEAGSSAEHKRFLLVEHDRKTVLTKAFSGRPARSIETTFTKLMSKKPVLPFPIQNTLTAKLRADAVRGGNGEYQSLWAGTGFTKSRSLTAAELVETLAIEAELN